MITLLFMHEFAASPEFKLALIQLAVGTSKVDNLLRAGRFIQEAASKGAHLVTLPECFNSPYGTGT